MYVRGIMITRHDTEERSDMDMGMGLIMHLISQIDRLGGGTANKT